MDYNLILSELQQASTFDLFRLQAAIGTLLDDPARLAAIKRELRPGMEITYFDAERTRQLLEDVHGAYNTRINDLLLAALAAVLGEDFCTNRVLIALEGHGREREGCSLDLTRTVGWFTSLTPVTLPAAARGEPGALIGQVKETLRALPSHGVGFGTLRYLSDDSEVRNRLASLPAPQVLFNYLGQLDRNAQASARFQPVEGGLSLSRDPGNRRFYALEVNAMVVGGRLRVEWTCRSSSELGHRTDHLASAYIQHLGALVDHCLNPAAGGFTPSDFAQAGLDQDELDSLLEDLDEGSL